MEKDYITIPYMKKQIIIMKYISETNYQFNKKLKYITMLELHKIKHKYIRCFSDIWYSIKFKNCVYSNKIIKKILYDKTQ